MMMSRAILRTTVLSGGPFPTPDPFLFCVYHVDDYPADASGNMEAPFAGNGADFNALAPYRMYHGDKIPGFPAHPHRGFETVTATVSGVIDHADSVGNAGRYGDGDVQWMTAGEGVVHGEMFPLVHADRPNMLKLFQIWLNLPSRQKMCSPSFAMFWNENIHTWKSDHGNVSVTTWIGDNYFSRTNNDTTRMNSPPPNSWAADPENDVAIFHITLRTGGKLVLPKAKMGGVINRSLYLIEGHYLGVKVDGKVLSDKVCLDMDATLDVAIELPPTTSNASDEQKTEFLLLQGRPIREPVAQHGPFVMNTQSEIKQAFEDYQRTRFGGWPWPRDDMVFPKEKGRFALIDGVESFPPSVVDKKEDEL